MAPRRPTTLTGRDDRTGRWSSSQPRTPVKNPNARPRDPAGTGRFVKAPAARLTSPATPTPGQHTTPGSSVLSSAQSVAWPGSSPTPPPSSPPGPPPAPASSAGTPRPGSPGPGSPAGVSSSPGGSAVFFGGNDDDDDDDDGCSDVEMTETSQEQEEEEQQQRQQQQHTLPPMPGRPTRPPRVRPVLPPAIRPQPPLSRPWCMRCIGVMGNSEGNRPWLDRSNHSLGKVTLATLRDCSGRVDLGKCTRCVTQSSWCHTIPSIFRASANVLIYLFDQYHQDTTSVQTRARCEGYGKKFNQAIKKWVKKEMGKTSDRQFESAIREADAHVRLNTERYRRGQGILAPEKHSNRSVDQAVEDEVRVALNQTDAGAWWRYYYLDGYVWHPSTTAAAQSSGSGSGSGSGDSSYGDGSDGGDDAEEEEEEEEDDNDNIIDNDNNEKSGESEGGSDDGDDNDDDDDDDDSSGFNASD